MSEKRVNIRITASTSDFDKAIKKAQNQIEKLTKTIEDMGNGKFGDKLEKQLEKVTDAAKDMQKQLEEMQESLDDMNKSKVDKLEKKLDDVSDSAEDLNEELEDTADTLDDLNKAKVDKLEKQFEDTKKTAETLDEKLEDVIDSLKDMDDLDIDNVTKSFEDVIDANQDLKRRIDELLDNFDELDSQDLNRLENEFDQIITSIRDLGDEIRETTNDLNKYIEDITNETNDLDNAIDDIDGDGFNRIKETVQELDEYIDEMTDSTKDFNREAGELDTSGIDRYADAMKGITGADGSINIDGDSSNKGNKDGLLDNVSDNLMSGAVAGKMMASSLDKVVDRLDDVTDKMEHLQDISDDDIDKSIDELGEEYRDAQSSLGKLTEEYDELIKKQKELDDNKADMESRNNQYKQEIQPLLDEYEKVQTAMKDMRDQLEEEMDLTRQYNQAKEEMRQKLLDVNEAIEKQTKVVDDIANVTDEARDKWLDCGVALDDLTDSYQHLFTAIEKAREAGKNDFADGLEKQWQQVAKALEDTKKEYDEIEKAFRNADDKWTEENNKLEALKEEKQLYSETAKELEEFGKNISMTEERYKELNKQVEEFEKRAEDLAKTVKQFTDIDITQDEELEKLKKQMQETEEAAEGLADDIDDVSNKMAEMNKVAQGHADEFDKQYKAYEKLSKQIEEYISDESKADILRKETAESFRDAANAMEAMYAGAKKLNNMDQVNKTLEETKDCLKEVSLVDFDGVMNELDKFNKRIEDTIDKQKRYKETSKHFGTDDGNKAYSLQMQAKALKEWADSADFVIEASNTLTHAWGNLSAAGEDNLKIRERSKYIDDYGKTLEENIAHIKNYYYELQTLDEIYEECTDKQRAVIDDYKAWEKNKEKLEEYNQAIRDYLIAIKDSGGQISDKFKDDSGNFDYKKFIENYEKFGEQSATLKRSQEALKVKILATVESLIKNAEASEKAAKEAVKHAEAVRDQAKAQEAAANSEEERIEAAKKLANAEEELAEAKKKLSNFDKDLLENLDKLIKKFDEGSEKARQLGINMKDIAKIDISNIDGGKPFASLLDNMETFGSDIPKTMSELKRQVQAVFADMEGFDFGGLLDGLKDIGAGLLSKIPNELKLAAAAAAAIGYALKESAEMGIEHFNKGSDTIKNALSGIVDIARDIGQELISAFENITGMDMDFSSLIEMPIDFESQMAKVGAIAGVTGDAFEELEEEARRLGSTTRYSATEVAEAMEYMGMAGWDNKQILAGLESVLSLATVAQMDLGQASDFVTDGLTALGYEAEDAAKFVDVLAKASTSSNTSVAQMQKAFTNCAPVAGTLGISMEDLSIALGLMADKGVKGAKAGTALKNLMANLSAPTEKQLAYIKKFNLEGAQQDIVQGNLIEGLKKFKSALSNLTPQQQNAVISTIAGKEALSGISALLNTTESDLSELEDAIRNCDGAATEMANNFDDTVKGALLGLSSAMQETLLQVFDKCKDDIKTVTKQLTEFFNILNGFSTGGNGSGLSDALTYLEGISEGWGEAIAQNLEKAIASIDDFINGGNFDKVLQIGTNIINGICDGIQAAADNGTLDSAISGAIKRIATWFSENLDTIVDVGKEVIDAISKGISENGDAIGKCIKEVMEMQTEIDKAIAHEKWKLIGENLVTFILEGLWSKISVFWSGLTGFLESGITEAFEFIAEWMVKGVGTLFFDPVKAIGTMIGEWLRDFIIEEVQDAFNIDISNWGGWSKSKDSKKSSTSSKSTGKTPDTSSITGKSPIDLINSELSSGKVKTDTTAAEIGQGISDNITKKLETMDAGALKELNMEMEHLQATTNSLASGMGTAFVAIQDAARTSFMGLTNIVRNQMLNCTNIVRNQAINWYNIINNQVTNARNILTTQMLSMAAVTRTQMVNVSNIIRNQAVTWYNIINNQITNARNAFTKQMISMASVARTQMTNVTNIIRNQTANWKTAIDNASKNLATSASNIGKNISSGISKGISSGTSTISSAVSSYKNSLLSSVKKAFGIKSPSTVMRDEVGYYLASGIEEGLNAGINTASANKLADNMVNSINSRMGNINSVNGSNLIGTDSSQIQAITSAMNVLNKTLSNINMQIKELSVSFAAITVLVEKFAMQIRSMAVTLASATKNMSLNVSTNYSGLSANALYAANNASTMSLGNNMSALASNASYAMSTGGGSMAGSSIGSNVTLEIPVMLDGKELARASAKYVDSELKLMTKRENRKRGAK